MHLSTLAMWFIIRSLEALDGHCGYEFTWSPFRLIRFTESSKIHNFHHS